MKRELQRNLQRDQCIDLSESEAWEEERHLQKRHLYTWKETYKGDPQKRPTKETYVLTYQSRKREKKKDTYKRDIYIYEKRPTRETYKRDPQKRPMYWSIRVGSVRRRRNTTNETSIYIGLYSYGEGTTQNTDLPNGTSMNRDQYI